MSSKPQEIPDADGEEIHVTWESPVFDLSGYAASSRSALLGLLEAGVHLRLIPFRSVPREADADQNSG
jgi:hypothetical protein